MNPAFPLNHETKISVRRGELEAADAWLCR
jgi:hypothetical protein